MHFDAHLDTWDTYFNAPTTHGTIFRRAFEERLLIPDHSIHVGIRGPVYGQADLDNDRKFGFRTIRASDIDDLGVRGTIDAITNRVDGLPVYLSVDIEVAPPFDHGEITSLAAATIIFDLITLLARRHAAG